MNREVLDQWCERGILGFALGLLVFLPLAFGGFPQPAAGLSLDWVAVDPLALAQWLMLPLMGLWLVRLWLNPKPRLLWPPICWAVLAFSAYAIGRYFTAEIEYVARQELIRVILYALLFFVVLNNLHRQETMQLVSFVLIGLATLISFYALYQFLTDSDRVWHLLKSDYHHRGSGTFICPNHTGGFLEMLLPLSLSYALMGRLKPVAKILVGYASLVILAGITVTLSRGTWLSTGVALALLFGILLFDRTYRLPAALLLLVMLGIGISLVPKSDFFKERVNHLVSAEGKVDDDLRFSVWKPALRVWQTNPWWGVGPAHFDYRFRMYRPEAVQASPRRVHNDYLNTLVDWGIVGTALVASAWGLLAFGVWKTWRFVRKTPADIGGKKSSSKFAFLLGALLGLAAILCHSLVDFNMHIPANAALAVTLMALLSSNIRFATERFWFTAGLFTKVCITLVVLAGLGFLGQQAARRGPESLWRARAARPNIIPEEQLYCLKRAVALEPMNEETVHSIGENLRLQSAAGPTDYAELAAQAMAWYGRGFKLNRWDGDNYWGYGWCLDWMDRKNESAPYFDQADRLDPNSFSTMAMIGSHYMELQDYAGAKPWFERSMHLAWKDNPIASNSLLVVNRKLREAANGEAASPRLQPPAGP
jgi:O-antigen ligase